MSGVKELAQLSFELSKFFALQALFEHLGILFNRLDLKDPISLNWVRFRPGIWDGGTVLSTGSWAWERWSTHGCLGFTPKRGSKQYGIDILPIFLLGFGSNLQMWMASLASQVTWEGSLSIMLKLESDGNGSWWSVQCFSMAEVDDLQCSFACSPRALEVSLT